MTKHREETIIAGNYKHYKTVLLNNMLKGRDVIVDDDYKKEYDHVIRALKPNGPRRTRG